MFLRAIKQNFEKFVSSLKFTNFDTNLMRNLVIALLLLLFFIPLSGFSNTPKPVEVMNFEEFSPLLQNSSDTVYVINFWATWCAPCVREIPVFERLRNEYSEQKLRIILVSLDFPNQLESRLIPFVQRMEMKNQVILLDAPRANKWIPIVDGSWSGALPATLIYNQESRTFLEKELHFEELDQIISLMLN